MKLDIKEFDDNETQKWNKANKTTHLMERNQPVLIQIQFFLFFFWRKMPTKDESSTPILRDDENDEENSQTFNDDELNTAFEFGGGCCNPSSTCHRFIALLLICLTGFGEYF